MTKRPDRCDDCGNDDPSLYAISARGRLRILRCDVCGHVTVLTREPKTDLGGVLMDDDG